MNKKENSLPPPHILFKSKKEVIQCITEQKNAGITNKLTQRGRNLDNKGSSFISFVFYFQTK